MPGRIQLGASADEHCVCVVCGADYWDLERGDMVMHKSKDGKWKCDEHLVESDKPRIATRSREAGVAHSCWLSEPDREHVIYM